MRACLGAAVAAALVASAGPALAQQTAKLANIAELSGAGAALSAHWRDGAILAVDEINQKGGILGRKIELANYDTQSNPGMARAQMQKALEDEPYAILGPIFSGMVKVSMMLAQQAEVPQLIGGEASELTQLGNQYLFRTSFGRHVNMQKIANYIRDAVKARSIALVWINTDAGKIGRDDLVREMNARSIRIAADIPTEQGQSDFAAEVAKVKGAHADAIFVYTNEEESAHFLREARRQSVDVPLIGETALASPRVIELAGDAANGVRAHVGLSADAPIPAIQELRAKFQKRFNYVPDQNGIKGYTAVYAIRHATEKKVGKLDRKALAHALHGLTISPDAEPGILIETSWDDSGDIDRISFLAEVVNGRPQITTILPKVAR